MIDAKAHFNGMIELTRSNLYVRMKSEKPEHLALYKIEASTIENFRRIHNLLRRICKLITGAEETMPPDRTVPPAPENDGP